MEEMQQEILELQAKLDKAQQELKAVKDAQMTEVVVDPTCDMATELSRQVQLTENYDRLRASIEDLRVEQQKLDSEYRIIKERLNKQIERVNQQTQAEAAAGTIYKDLVNLKKIYTDAIAYVKAAFESIIASKETNEILVSVLEDILDKFTRSLKNKDA